MKPTKLYDEKKPLDNVIPLRIARTKKESRICNLCKQTFKSRSKFDRFCQGCKAESELYHFYESLPAC